MKKSPYSVGFLITKVGRIATKMYADNLEEIGLTPLQAGILGTLASRDGLNQRQLMGALHADKGTIHQMLKGLGLKKLIVMETAAEDKRQLKIRITRRGRGLLPRIAEIDALVSRELLSRVSPSLRKPLENALLEVYIASAH